MLMFEVLLKCLCSFDQCVKFARVVVFLSLLKMAESTRLKLFQKLIEVHIDAYKEKIRKDVKLEMSREWKEMKKRKDLDLEIALDKRISEPKKLSTKKKLRSMAIWSKFVSGNVNEKHSGGGNSQDVDVDRVSSKFFS